MTEEQMLEICQRIGMVAESSSLYTAGLVNRLGSKSLEQLTVAELLTLIDTHTAFFNQLYGTENDG